MFFLKFDSFPFSDAEQEIHRIEYLTDDGRPCRTCNAPIEYKDEDGVKDDVSRTTYEHTYKALIGASVRTNERSKCHIDRKESKSKNYRSAVIEAILNRLIRGTEEPTERLKQYLTYHGEYNTKSDRKYDGIAHALGNFIGLTLSPTAKTIVMMGRMTFVAALPR